MPTPPRNPYIAGKALGDARGFFGREDVFRLVETVLSSPDQNSIVLFEPRRIGKTSIKHRDSLLGVQGCSILQSGKVE